MVNIKTEFTQDVSDSRPTTYAKTDSSITTLFISSLCRSHQTSIIVLVNSGQIQKKSPASEAQTPN